LTLTVPNRLNTQDTGLQLGINSVVICWMYLTTSSDAVKTVTLPYTYTTRYVCPIPGHNIDSFSSSSTIAPRTIHHYKPSLSGLKLQLYKSSPREVITIGY